MSTWQIGDVSITKVLEMEKHWPFSALLPGAEDVVDEFEWMKPDFVTEEGKMKLSIPKYRNFSIGVETMPQKVAKSGTN